LKQTLRNAILLFFACGALAVFSISAQAQKIDLAFGVSTFEAPSTNSNGPSLTGGAYTGFSGDVLFFHNMGVGGEIFWKATQGEYTGVNYRPVVYDFDAVYSPKLASHTFLELSAGIGAMDTRIYCGSTPNCGSYYSNYNTDTHFMGDFGAGLKIYPTHNFFIRPEAKIYLVNNNQLYSSFYSTRVGASIGYTFR
jgi:hypothetical protein